MSYNFLNQEYNSDRFQVGKNDTVFMETILSFKPVQMISMPESWNGYENYVEPQLFDSLDWIAASSIIFMS
jgi:hypothetical protein